MLSLISGFLAIIAVAAWLTAVVSAFQIVALSPRGMGLTFWFDIGKWRFDRITKVAGPPAAPLIARYRYAFLAFFASILLIAVAVMLLAAERQN